MHMPSMKLPPHIELSDDSRKRERLKLIELVALGGGLLVSRLVVEGICCRLDKIDEE